MVFLILAQIWLLIGELCKPIKAKQTGFDGTKTTDPWLVVLYKEPKENEDQDLLDKIHSAASEIYQE